MWLPSTGRQDPFFAAARWAREAKLPLEVLPPPRFAPEDWMRDAALPVIPFAFAIIGLLFLLCRNRRAL